MQDTLCVIFFYIKFKTPPYRQRILEYVTQRHSDRFYGKAYERLPVYVTG